jgi:hypothetical protein
LPFLKSMPVVFFVRSSLFWREVAPYFSPLVKHLQSKVLLSVLSSLNMENKILLFGPPRNNLFVFIPWMLFWKFNECWMHERNQTSSLSLWKRTHPPFNQIRTDSSFCIALHVLHFEVHLLRQFIPFVTVSSEVRVPDTFHLKLWLISSLPSFLFHSDHFFHSDDVMVRFTCFPNFHFMWFFLLWVKTFKN